jgi:hypothetical protein
MKTSWQNRVRTISFLLLVSTVSICIWEGMKSALAYIPSEGNLTTASVDSLREARLHKGKVHTSVRLSSQGLLEVCVFHVFFFNVNKQSELDIVQSHHCRTARVTCSYYAVSRSAR